MKILVVEDDIAINNLMRSALELEGFEVLSAFKGAQARDFIDHERLDLAIVDLMLPDANGLDILQYINTKEVPVIIVSAVIGSHNISKGLELGADDYLTKPFDIMELQARVNALLRRVKGKAKTLRYKDILINCDANEVFKNDALISLTTKEYELLIYLIENKDIALSRSTLYEVIWGDDLTYETRTLDLHIQRLRKKLDLKEEIQSVYKVGYKLGSL